MQLSYIDRTNDRQLAGDYNGDVLIWDIDKTYLDTRFSSLRGLASIPFDFAIDKKSIPGAVPLLRELRRGPHERSALVPLYFISGSPKQLRPVIERKMTLDGVEYDGITFKDQLGLFKARRVRDIRRQLGYKLLALLAYRSETPDGARWLLFGDDVEEDASIFVMFGEICAGLRGSSLEARLESRKVPADQRDQILQMAEKLPAVPDPVERIFIHLELGTDPSSLPGLKTVATRSFLQTALVLAMMNRLRPEAIGAVASDLRRRHVSESDIEESLRDARGRLGVPAELIRAASR